MADIQLSEPSLLRVVDLHTHFRVRSKLPWQAVTLRAVNGVSLSLARGETLAIVGESGCGKSTLGRTIVGLQPATRGTVQLEAQRTNQRDFQRRVQIVFQDPYGSLDPLMSVHDIVAEPLRINRCYSRSRVTAVLHQVGLPDSALPLRPSQFSGGQRQRIAIARALVLTPEVLILDEAVSALDVSVRAQVINLLRQLQRDMGLSYLFISHDLSVVQHIADRVAVMYLGKIVEIGPRHQVFEGRGHPYTKSLISAVPRPDPVGRETRSRIVLKGDLPSPMKPVSGCSFRTRCFRAAPLCAETEPELTERTGLFTACHFPMSDAPPEVAHSATRS